MKQDNQTIVLMHLSQLATPIIAFGSILIPLIIWFTQKEKVKDLDTHGKMILNFQFSMLIYSFVCIPLILVGVGILGLLIILVLSIVYPIKNAVRASNQEAPEYPYSIIFLK
ncbi:MAG: DUF4870 domain-containing protein [Flavobacteriaceae bacterium]|jgi:uncharacterized Tic20 family protein|nr:DUF4870 domain-containing protein [Flavobacteriaceae bacterium]MDA7728193.1 DUF4870 domain-containing protein [Flavobacteriaceae bacterium]MDA7848569.1 DUF4870 domain-containing protein [Flavobacteriaceae bacterium]MDG1309032.1 DUF4870 domain-containing protein [Flavobacteriaceae bacterium]|tara:strand:+ start:17539 stop:17874 length:336 start_codon:yes stop_codon:yes gene_type:complete